MKKLVKYEDGLPTIEEVYNLLKEHEQVYIESSSIDAKYVNTLTDEFTDYFVAYYPWNKWIAIHPSISTQKILEKQDEIYACAKAFRQDAWRLMEKMSLTFGLNLETLEGLYELKFCISVNQRGKLDEEWNYYFHGAECRFDNMITGQVVEIVLVKAEYGCLDAYFFYHYMQTTEMFQQLANFFGNDDRQVQKAIHILAKQGRLTQHDNQNSLGLSRNIFAS